MTASLDTLIADLGADLRPVRRLHAPVLRACAWLALVTVLAVALSAFADWPAVAYRLRFVPDMWLAGVGSTLTMVLAAIAAFELSLPDRKPAWALLPLPGLLLWVATTGAGCLRSTLIPDMHAASMAETGECFRFIVLLSMPLSIVMILMVRRACPLHPNLTAATGGLAAAAAAATLLNLFHPYDAGATDMAVHMVAIVVVIALNRLLGGHLLAPKSYVRRL